MTDARTHAEPYVLPPIYTGPCPACRQGRHTECDDLQHVARLYRSCVCQHGGSGRHAELVRARDAVAAEYRQRLRRSHGQDDGLAP